jgi:hypothetical protein
MLPPAKISIGKWAPAIWDGSQAIAMVYPEAPTDDDKTKYQNYFTVLGTILPCPNCQVHYQTNTAAGSPTALLFDSRKTLVRSLHKLHNKVNVDTGKPEYPFSKFIWDYVGGSATSFFKSLDMTDDEITQVQQYQTDFDTIVNASKQAKEITLPEEFINGQVIPELDDSYTISEDDYLSKLQARRNERLIIQIIVGLMIIIAAVIAYILLRRRYHH